MQERGLAAYLAELIGTLLLVFFITSVVVLFVSTGSQAQFGSDFAVIGLVHAFLLFGLIVMFGVVSGGHFNPAVTLAAMVIRRIKPLDGAIYMLAQLSGAVLGALLTKGLLLDEGRATHYGAAEVSGLLSGAFPGSIVEGIGTFCLVLVILAAVYSEKSLEGLGAAGDRHHPRLHRHGRRPADRRCLQPGPLVRPRSGRQRLRRLRGVWPYLAGPIVGALLAAAVYRFVLEPGGLPPTEAPERIRPPIKKRAEPNNPTEPAP